MCHSNPVRLKEDYFVADPLAARAGDGVEATICAVDGEGLPACSPGCETATGPMSITLPVEGRYKIAFFA